MNFAPAKEKLFTVACLLPPCHSVTIFRSPAGRLLLILRWRELLTHPDLLSLPQCTCWWVGVGVVNCTVEGG